MYSRIMVIIIVSRIIFLPHTFTELEVTENYIIFFIEKSIVKCERVGSCVFLVCRFERKLFFSFRSVGALYGTKMACLKIQDGGSKMAAKKVMSYYCGEIGRNSS